MDGMIEVVEKKGRLLKKSPDEHRKVTRQPSENF